MILSRADIRFGQKNICELFLTLDGAMLHNSTGKSIRGGPGGKLVCHSRNKTEKKPQTFLRVAQRASSGAFYAENAKLLRPRTKQTDESEGSLRLFLPS